MLYVNAFRCAVLHVDLSVTLRLRGRSPDRKLWVRMCGRTRTCCRPVDFSYYCKLQWHRVNYQKSRQWVWTDVHARRLQASTSSSQLFIHRRSFWRRDVHTNIVFSRSLSTSAGPTDPVRRAVIRSYFMKERMEEVLTATSSTGHEYMEKAFVQVIFYRICGFPFNTNPKSCCNYWLKEIPNYHLLEIALHTPRWEKTGLQWM